MILGAKKETSLCLVFSYILLLNCSSLSVPKFDSEKAFAELNGQCQIGPRYPNSPGHDRCRKYLLDKLSGYTNLVKIQDFTYRDEALQKDLKLTNLIASFYPEKKERVLLCAHWDTRPFADQDPDSSLRSKPILGANDGASGVAILLEIARIISQRKSQWGVDLIFFDGEDWGPESDLDKFCLGSKYFAKNKGNYQPQIGILLDMVGGKNLQLYKEAHSFIYAQDVLNLVWERAKKLGFTCFKDSIQYFVYDDHIPLLEAGIPCIDLIDFDYPWYHTVSDTPAKCSPQSLQIIGDLLVDILYHPFELTPSPGKKE